MASIFKYSTAVASSHLRPPSAVLSRLEGPRDERREAAGFFLKIVESLEMVHAMLEVLADAEHHGRGGAHAELVRSAVNVEPVFGQAFRRRCDGALRRPEFPRRRREWNRAPRRAAGRSCRADSRPLNSAMSMNLRRRKAVKVNLRKPLLDAAQHLSYHSIFRSGCRPPCISTPVPPRSSVS